MLSTLMNFFKPKDKDFAGAMKKANCTNLVPATLEVKRPHCNMGDGREGDCQILLGHDDDCAFRVLKNKPLTREQILEKVKEEEHRQRCLNASICPDCGGKLGLSDDLLFLECSPCGKDHVI